MSERVSRVPHWRVPSEHGVDYVHPPSHGTDQPEADEEHGEEAERQREAEEGPTAPIVHEEVRVAAVRAATDMVYGAGLELHVLGRDRNPYDTRNALGVELSQDRVCASFPF